jgi:hypothetical protein
MMGKRHEVIGIKQVVRIEWYDLALDYLLGGQSASTIRTCLDDTIRERRQSGGFGDRGDQTYTKAVTQIMKCWISPDRELIPFRDALLDYARQSQGRNRLTLHWAITVAAYPFWYKVAFQVGRLLNLQDSITQNQIRQRCFEALGQRSTVERSARRVIRSFVAWGALMDSEAKGCYEKVTPVKIADKSLAVLMLESVLLATPEGKCTAGSLLNNPAFFPLQLPVMTGDFVAQHSDRIDVVRYGPADELMKLKNS